jgi:hypothetical protein
MDFRGLMSILYMEYDMLSRGADPGDMRKQRFTV